jgi:hypothetical protein
LHERAEGRKDGQPAAPLPGRRAAPHALVACVLLASAALTRRAAADETNEASEAREASELRARTDALAARLDAQQAELEKLKGERKGEVHFSGYAQIDWVTFRQSSQDELDPSGQPLNENRFLVRRARLRAETDRGVIAGSMDLDANTVSGPQVRPWGAEVAAKWPAATPAPSPRTDITALTDGTFFVVSAGLIYTPFGYEVPETEIRRPFLERTTMSNALFPQSMDLGVRMLGGFHHLYYALGIMNGDPIGEKAFPGRDPNASKDLVFRVGTATRPVDAVRVAGGFSGLSGRGFHSGTPSTKDQLVWRDANEDGIVQPQEITIVPGAPATPSENFTRFALGADLRLTITIPWLGDLALRGELVRAKNLDRGLVVADPVAASRDLRESGFYVGGTQEITRWAMIGVRYDRYDPDSDRQDQQALHLVPTDASYRTWSLMACARFEKARLVVQYDARSNAIGRAPNGAPTTLADDSLTFRAEVAF